MKILVVFLFSIFLLSSCKKQEKVLFDITVKNVDNSLVTEGFVRILGYRNGTIGLIILYQVELPLSDTGEIHREIPLDSKFTEFQVSYWKDNDTPSQTITGCNHKFDPRTCELSDGQRVFDIEIIVL